MSRTTTITVTRETKTLLSKLKGRETWDSFLRKLAVEELRKRRERVREELGRLLELEYEEVRVRSWARES
uniref:Uncharacterized protein n=1 Tax=Thermofilum pendens TaxID=2269 RepID=A0A7J3X784_THEPE